MAHPTDLEARLAALEARMEEVAADVAAARHLSAARDRDLADLGVKVDAKRTTINALSGQTAGRVTASNNSSIDWKRRSTTGSPRCAARPLPGNSRSVCSGLGAGLDGVERLACGR